MIESLNALKKSKIKYQLFKGGRPWKQKFCIDACKTAIDNVIIFKTVSTEAHKSKLKLTDLDLPAKTAYVKTRFSKFCLIKAFKN